MSPPQGSRGFASWFMFIGTIIGAIIPLYFLVEKYHDSFCIFTPEQLHDLSQRAIANNGNNTQGMVDYIVNELAELNPANINTNQEWFFNNAGGAMGGMYIIHASVTEYLIIFGTAVGTEGHTGRHTSDDYFNILSGTQLAYAPGQFEPEVYPPGSVHHLRRGEVKQYKMPESCFALEYARGWIPPMLFFGYADGFTSTLDVGTLWTMTRASAVEIVGNLLRLKF